MAMTFGEIERVIGAPLPPAALKHRALWSNNPSNWVMTKAWLAAGYETEKVDMEDCKLVFRKATSDAPDPDAGGEPSRGRGRGRGRTQWFLRRQFRHAEGHDNDSAWYEPDGPDRPRTGTLSGDGHVTDFLLDTCAVIWTAHNDPLREPAASELQDAYRRGGQLFVSPITAWEIAMLVAKEKIALALDPDLWFQRFCEAALGDAGRDADLRAGLIDPPAWTTTA